MTASNWTIAIGIARRTRCVGFALVLCAAPQVQAQSPAADSARVSSARDVLLSFPLGSPIRILTVGQSVIEGRLAALTDTGIVIRQRRDSSHASLARLAEIYRSAPNLKRGAIIGGVTGGILGALMMGTLASGLCERADCGGAFTEGATLGAAFGAAIGAVAGLGAGALTHHWERVW